MANSRKAISRRRVEGKEFIVRQGISRRRMIAITAGAAGYTLANGSKATGISPLNRPVVWRGVALGADAQIILYHDDRKAAKAILERCRQEISRLENLFSLYRPDSRLNQLNQNGMLDDPDPEMLELFSRSLMISHETSGAFDISVQPLWQLYANHFTDQNSATTGPDPSAVRETLQLVDYRQVGLSAEKIELKKRGMRITLNGIAQGYITDRIAALLRRNGWQNVLINLGEIVGMGRKPTGQAWKAAIANPEKASGIVKSVSLDNRALATSGGYGTLFSRDGKYHHLFDPRTGSSTRNYKSVSVTAREATTADALSTAFSAMRMGDIKCVLERFPDTAAIIVQNNNEIAEL